MFFCNKQNGIGTCEPQVEPVPTMLNPNGPKSIVIAQCPVCLCLGSRLTTTNIRKMKRRGCTSNMMLHVLTTGTNKACHPIPAHKGSSSARPIGSVGLRHSKSWVVTGLQSILYGGGKASSSKPPKVMPGKSPPAPVPPKKEKENKYNMNTHTHIWNPARKLPFNFLSRALE